MKVTKVQATAAVGPTLLSGQLRSSSSGQTGLRNFREDGTSGERGISKETLDQAVDALNRGIQQLAHKRLRFQVHDATNRLFVRVIDTQTDEVIKELPPEQVLDAVAKMKEFIGILLDEHV